MIGGEGDTGANCWAAHQGALRLVAVMELTGPCIMGQNCCRHSSVAGGHFCLEVIKGRISPVKSGEQMYFE